MSVGQNLGPSFSTTEAPEQKFPIQAQYVYKPNNGGPTAVESISVESASYPGHALVFDADRKSVKVVGTKAVPFLYHIELVSYLTDLLNKGF